MIKFILIFSALAGPFARSQQKLDLTPDSKEALEKTQIDLRNPQRREAEIQKNGNFKKADQQVEKLVGKGQKKDELYQISAKALEDLVRKANGDPTVMRAMILEAQKNPEKFYQEVLTEDVKAQIRQLANDVEKSQNPQPPK